MTMGLSVFIQILSQKLYLEILFFKTINTILF